MNRLYLCELWMLRTDILYSELLLVQTVGGISSIIASHNKDIEMELIVSMTQLSWPVNCPDAEVQLCSHRSVSMKYRITDEVCDQCSIHQA